MNYLHEKPRLHNKQFQFYAIMDRANGIVREPRLEPLKAIGFGVGREPIPAALVSLGFKVTATDFLDGKIADVWTSSAQQSKSLLDLNERKIVSDNKFVQSCDFQNLDMNKIPDEYIESFDFVWSSCALGHIGSYQQGLDFILNSLTLLRPGGWAVHTTEIDTSPVLEKFESPDLSFYKLEDLENLIEKAQDLGFAPIKIEKRPWVGRSEKYVVSQPWKDKPHLRIEIFGREINSIVIQIQRPG
jgi:hypothetical protein